MTAMLTRVTACKWLRRRKAVLSCGWRLILRDATEASLLLSKQFDESLSKIHHGDTPRVGLERERLGKHPTQTTHHPRGSERMQGSPILEHDRLRPIPNGAGSVLFDTEGFESDPTDFVGERQGFR